MSNLELFNFNENQVRIILIEAEPWFVAKDIADVLGYSNTTDAISRHVDDEDKSSIGIFTDAGFTTPNLDYQTKVINESGLYSLVLSSRLEKAKEFKRWVTKEVLPSIRKTGSYNMPEYGTAEWLLVTAQRMVDNEKRLKKLEEEQRKIKEEQEENRQRAIEAAEVLGVLPQSEVKALKPSDRAAINQLVRAYATNNNTSYTNIWSKLYQELYYRYSYDAKARAKNSKNSALDCVERDGHMANLYAIASEILK